MHVEEKAKDFLKIKPLMQVRNEIRQKRHITWETL